MNTPLHIAIQNNNIEIVKALLADGCDINERNADGLNPLDLATMLNNEEIVRLLLEHGAGHLPPPPIVFHSLDAEQRKKRITFWTIACIIMLVIFGFVSIIDSVASLGITISASEMPAGHQEQARIGLSICIGLILIPTLIAYAICIFFYIFRLWEEIPKKVARTTPGMAAGLLLIPIFSLYWMFIAFVGLYQDMNKTLESYGRGTRFSTTLTITACVVWLLSFFFFFILGLMRVIFESASGMLVFVDIVCCLSSLLWYLFTMAVLWIIRKDVVEFIDIKSSVGQ